MRDDILIPQHTDIIVVGGGPVGSLVALRFAAAGHKVIVIEASANMAPIRDARALALSWGSHRRLCEVGAWHSSLLPTAVNTVHVSQQGVWGRTVIRSEDLALPHLGWVVDYPALTLSLRQQLQAAGVSVLWSTRVNSVQTLAAYAKVNVTNSIGNALLTCRLVVLAEGGALAETLPGIRRRSYDYQQRAVVAHVTTERFHHGVAYERFTDQGPLALLPHGDGFIMIWTRSPDEAERLKKADNTTLCGELQSVLGARQGKVLTMSERAVFPLMLKQVNRVFSGRVVFVGNAAQTMHPVAAQGLNLGLRDASVLADIVGLASDAGDRSLLVRYAEARCVDSYAMVGFTHGLTHLVAAKSHVSKRVRGAGMALLDSLPAVRKAFAAHLVWGVGCQPF